MKHSHVGATLQSMRNALARAPEDPEADASLTGVSFLELEPDLQKEAGGYTRHASGWAAGGHPASD